jgi:hypothetical protein
MPKILKISTVFALGILLSGCSIFYPNWGATSLPEEPTGIVTPSESASVTPSETVEPETSESASPTQPAKKQAEVVVVFYEILSDEGILSVVAEMDSAAETGGSCTLKFVSGAKEKSFTVKSEPSSTYTQCFPFEIPLEQLPSGNGTFSVSYISESFEGQSAASSVVIP